MEDLMRYVETYGTEATDVAKYVETHGIEAARLVIQDESHHEFVGFSPGSLLEKLKGWNGVFRDKMQEAATGRKRRRSHWQSIDAK